MHAAFVPAGSFVWHPLSLSVAAARAPRLRPRRGAARGLSDGRGRLTRARARRENEGGGPRVTASDPPARPPASQPASPPARPPASQPARPQSIPAGPAMDLAEAVALAAAHPTPPACPLPLPARARARVDPAGGGGGRAGMSGGAVAGGEGGAAAAAAEGGGAGDARAHAGEGEISGPGESQTDGEAGQSPCQGKWAGLLPSRASSLLVPARCSGHQAGRPRTVRLRLGSGADTRVIGSGRTRCGPGAMVKNGEFYGERCLLELPER
jgi:hypothetical protein